MYDICVYDEAGTFAVANISVEFFPMGYPSAFTPMLVSKLL